MKLLAYLALGASLLGAQTQSAQHQKNVGGEVVSADPSASKLQIKTDAGQTYSVTTSEKTVFLRIAPGETDLSKASRIAATDITMGDKVLARGPVDEDAKLIPATRIIVMTKGDLAQKHQKDLQEWARRSVSGTVTAVNAEAKQIQMSVRNGGPTAKTVTVDVSGNVEFQRYAPDSVKFSDAKPSSLAEIRIGDSLRVLGDKNEDGSQVKASDVVSGSFRTLAVQIISVDAAAGTLKVTDLQKKQPVFIHVNDSTTMKRMPEQMARFMALRLNAAGAGAPGGAAGAGRPAGGQGGEGFRRPDGQAGPPAGREGAPGGGGPGGGAPGGGRMGGNFDLQQALERVPSFTLAELKPGDALVISSTNGADPTHYTAITMVAGVEQFLASAPREAGVVNLGAWSFDIGGGAAQ
ncbi:MAG TPA: hypothetical protein VKU01_29720 [Bryobacteraceae bacterium]|nr:hypothetical protein [Bryobacteraceae bacterium]